MKATKILLVSTIIILVLSSCQYIPTRTVNQQESTITVQATVAFQPTKWEYKVYLYQLFNNPEEDLSKSLNELGNEGWELVSITTGGLSYIFVFKRPLN
jgi:hypothetical protein